MDDYGNKIRSLLGQGGQMQVEQVNTQGPLSFDENTSNQIAAYKTKCGYRNLRGECANPNVLDEDGMMMSWEKFDSLKAKGIDPKTVHLQRQRLMQVAGERGAPMFPPMRGGR